MSRYKLKCEISLGQIVADGQVPSYIRHIKHSAEKSQEAGRHMHGGVSIRIDQRTILSKKALKQLCNRLHQEMRVNPIDFNHIAPVATVIENIIYGKNAMLNPVYAVSWD